MKRMGCIMSKCLNCNIMVIDETDSCPLCKQILDKDGKAQISLYPDARFSTKKFRLFENIVLFLSIVTGVIGMFVEFMLFQNFGWSLVLILILTYANILLRLAIIGKSGYISKIVNMMVLAIALLFGIDYVTGYRGWAISYAYPAGILLMDVAIIVLMVANSRNWQSYMMLQIFTMLLSIGGMILWGLNIIIYPYVILAALAASVFLFLGTLIIGDQRARNEMKRRFHV